MERSLISLSLITSLWERRKSDYLDNFVPFIATLVCKKGITSIDSSKVGSFCDDFFSEFGLRIPYHPMIAILNRCKKHGLFFRKTFGIFYINKSKATEMDFAGEEAQFIRKEKILVVDFIRFAQENYNIDVDSSIVEELLLDMLRHSDIEILFANREIDSVLPTVSIAKKYKRYLHVLRRYIIQLHCSNFELFQYLANMALGHVITSAIVIEDYNWPGETVRNCSFYLDTPIIFKLIGAEGPEQATVYSDFLVRITRNGGKLWIFDHTYKEVMEILENSRRWVNNPDFDPERASRVTLYFRQEGFTDIDIEKFIIRVDKTLESREIGICNTPPYTEKKEYQIDELLLQRLIEEIYSERDPSFDKEQFETRTRRDVASISAVYRLRESNHPRFLRDAKHAFLTINVGLVRANKNYLQQQEDGAFELPACLTDVFVGTILWMNSPPEAKQDSRNKLLADCYAAVRPDPLLEKQLLEEAKRLRDEEEITEDDFVLLSTSFVTRDLLADFTLNDKDAFTTKTLFEILEDIKGRIKADAIQPYIKSTQELEAQQRKAEIERDKALSALDKLVDRKASCRARLINFLYATAVIIAIVAPLLITSAVKWYFLSILVVLGFFIAYLSFFRGFKFRENYMRVYQRHRFKLREKLLNQ